MRKSLLILLSLAVLIGCNTAQEQTVFLVRHAEKDSFPPKDPALTLDGVMRSVDLQKWFEGHQVDTILSSDTKRTKETAEPLAKDQSKEIGIYDPMKFDDLAKQIQAMDADTIVLIGHSNTILPQIEALGGTRPQEAIGENEYDKLFQINLSDKSVKVHQFGSKSK